MSVVEELKDYSEQILAEPDALTSLQKQARQDGLAKNLKKAGISFRVTYVVEDHSYDHISFTWSPTACVQGIGAIVDVIPVGDFPIHLSLHRQVLVRFEPRNLGDWEGRHSVSNRKFANLKKGDSYEFQGPMTPVRKLERHPRPPTCDSKLGLAERLCTGTIPWRLGHASIRRLSPPAHQRIC